MFNLKDSYPYQPEINHVAFDLVSKVMKDKKEVKNILDVGCGYGLLSKELKKTFPKFFTTLITHEDFKSKFFKSFRLWI